MQSLSQIATYLKCLRWKNIPVPEIWRQNVVVSLIGGLGDPTNQVLAIKELSIPAKQAYIEAMTG